MHILRIETISILITEPLTLGPYENWTYLDTGMR